MLKTIFVISVGLLVFSCGSPTTKKSSEKVKIETEKPVEVRDLLKEYEAYVASLDSTTEKSVNLATDKYVELFSKSDQKTCDSAFVTFHKLYEKIEGILNNSVFTGSEFSEIPCSISYDENGKELPIDKRLILLEKRMKKHGFRVECWEGFPGIGGERAFIASYFYKYVSPVMKQFLEGLRKERDQELGADAGIILSEEAYADRLVWWDNFNKKNPDFILAERAKSIQMYLFTYFLIGMDNTPSVNRPVDENGVETMELDGYFVKAYAYLDKKYPASPINGLVKPYAAAVQKNNEAKREKLIKTYTKRGLMIDFSKDFDWDL